MWINLKSNMAISAAALDIPKSNMMTFGAAVLASKPECERCGRCFG
jgi:hypothetical protein